MCFRLRVVKTPLTCLQKQRICSPQLNPIGFGGQGFIHSQLAKISAIRDRIDRAGRDIRLEVDGGVNVETARLCVEAGADVLVAGSATFKGGADCYAENIAALKAAGGEAA